MAYKDKIIKAQSAVKSRSSFDLSHHHLTTLDFGQLVPIDVQHEVLPGDSWNITQSLFARVAPLAVPTFGNCWLKTATFFVPYHQVAVDVESWLAGDKYYYGNIAQGRFMTYSVLIGLFLGDEFNVSTPHNSRLDVQFINNLGLVHAVKTNQSYFEAHDFVLKCPDGDHFLYCRFTSRGRYFYKILRSLGYGFFEGMSAQNAASNQFKPIWGQNINMLPLLSYFKAFNDWMSQSALYNRSEISSILNRIRYDWQGDAEDLYKLTTDLRTCFYLVRVPFESNYFTNAWRTPNEIYPDQGYNDNLFSPNAGLNLTQLGTGTSGTAGYDDANLFTDSVSTGVQSRLASLGQSLNTISERGLRFLGAFDKWLRRNNYSGARSVEKLLSRFGVKVEDYRNDFAILLDQSKTILNIGDVTNTTDFGSGSEGNPLGSYAGKGIINGDNKLSFKSSDFGTIITLAWLQPDVQYYDGIDRTTLKTAVSDFYQPEYDGLDAMPIGRFEFGQNPKDLDTPLPTAVFGFTERYNELRTPRNRVTGDFALDEDMSAWHFGFTGLGGGRHFREYIAQDDILMSQEQTGSEFDRIFVDDTSSAEDMRDHFYLTCYFDVNASRPMMSSSEVAGLGDGHLNIQRNGTQMS